MQVGLAALGLALLWNWGALKHDVNLGVEPTWNSLAFSLPIAMVGFTGLEKLTGLASLAKDPVRTVPRALRSSVFTVVVVYAAMATAATSAFPPHRDPSAAGRVLERAVHEVAGCADPGTGLAQSDRISRTRSTSPCGCSSA